MCLTDMSYPYFDLIVPILPFLSFIVSVGSDGTLACPLWCMFNRKVKSFVSNRL